MNDCEVEKGSEKMDENKTGYGVTHTLSEIAELLGISRERVRQIEKKALEKVRTQLKSRYGITTLAAILG